MCLSATSLAIPQFHVLGTALLLGVAACTDLYARRISDLWTIPMWGLGLTASVLLHTPTVWISQVALSLLLALTSYACYRRGWLGGGDVKLLMALGVWMTPQQCGQVLWATSFLMPALWIFAHLLRWRAGWRQPPFAVGLGLGGLWVLLFT